MKKVMLVFGTRPESIKMCPLIKALQKHKDIEVITAVTAQHREILDEVLLAFGICPDYDLSVMTHAQSLSSLTGKILDGITKLLDFVNPDLLLVHGDTTTAFTAALAAFYLGIPTGHIEAGLRTYDISSPFPEEFNRCAIGLIAKYHFVPTSTARDALISEGKDKSDIFLVGNTAIDALNYTVKESYTSEAIRLALGRKIIIFDSHRRESHGDKLKSMLTALKRLAGDNPDCFFVFPIHPNPKVKSCVKSELGYIDNILLTEPLGVVDFHNLLSRAYLILTDSGGIQEEAPSLGVPVFLMRDNTERPEGVECGAVTLVGTDGEQIYSSVTAFISGMGRAHYRGENPFGDGHASERCARIIKDILI